MKSVIKVLLICWSFMAVSVHAATISGSLLVGGDYLATGGSDLSDATDVDIFNVVGNNATGDVLSDINFGAPSSGAGLSLDAFVAVDDFISFGGWTLDIISMDIDTQSITSLLLSGTGVLSGNGFEATVAEWTFTSQSLTSFSVSATAEGIAVVPVPAAAWLFGSGLIGLVAVSRRKS